MLQPQRPVGTEPVSRCQEGLGARCHLHSSEPCRTLTLEQVRWKELGGGGWEAAGPTMGEGVLGAGFGQGAPPRRCIQVGPWLTVSPPQRADA